MTPLLRAEQTQTPPNRAATARVRVCSPATTPAATVVVTVILAAELLSRTAGWMRWLRAAVAIVGVGAATLILVASRLGPVATRVVAGMAVASCLAAPAAYSLATAATPHSGAIPSVGPSRSEATASEVPAC